MEQILLDEYRKYDHLNQISKKTLVKILVSYIKPSFLFKSEILNPIHLGRAVAKASSKDGVISDSDLEWLLKNCLGDDDIEDNISPLNRRVGFLTGTYLAWKNYDRLGNPEYFGSFGYRRLLAPEFLKDLKNFDLILPERKKMTESLKTQFCTSHGEIYYQTVIDILKNTFPDDIEGFEQYMGQSWGYFFEIYVMKKEYFFDFCEWVFRILFYFIENYPQIIETKPQIQRGKRDELITDFLGIKDEELMELKLVPQKNREFRDIAFMLERLTGYYLFKLSQNRDLKCKEVKVIEFLDSKKQEKRVQTMILSKMRHNISQDLARS